MTSNFNDFSNRDVDQRFTTDSAIRHNPSNFDNTGYERGTDSYGQQNAGFESSNRQHGGDFTTSTDQSLGTGQHGGRDYATSTGDRYGGVAGGMNAARGEQTYTGLRDVPPPSGTNNLERGSGAGWDGAGHGPDYDNGLQQHGGRGDFSDDLATGGRRAAGVNRDEFNNDVSRKPTMGEKIKGNVEVLTGKVTRNPEKVAEGQALKSGTHNTSVSGTTTDDTTRY
jgi:hypothetical protein